MQEEFSCQVTQGIGQSCNYTVYAVRCDKYGVLSEPVEVNLTSKLVLCTICTFTSIGAPHLTYGSKHHRYVNVHL